MKAKESTAKRIYQISRKKPNAAFLLALTRAEAHNVNPLCTGKGSSHWFGFQDCSTMGFYLVHDAETDEITPEVFEDDFREFEPIKFDYIEDEKMLKGYN